MQMDKVLVQQKKLLHHNDGCALKKKMRGKISNCPFFCNKYTTECFELKKKHMLILKIRKKKKEDEKFLK